MNHFQPDTEVVGNHAESARTPTTLPPEDTFDLERLRLSQNFTKMVEVKKVLITVPVRKPYRQDFIRVHADPSMRIETAILELKEERETFLVDVSLHEELSDELTPKVLFTAINRQGVLFVWPVRLPGEDGRYNDWNRSALEAAQLAMQSWVKVRANLSLGAYEVFEPAGSPPDPIWPDLSLQEVLRIAFKDRFIYDLDHPVLRRLRGEL